MKSTPQVVLWFGLLWGPALIPPAALSQSYPAKSIRIIDGFTAGGASDFQARTIGAKLTERFGQPVVVDNRPGVGGNIAAELAARSAPDGYTLFIGLTSQLAPSPSIYPNLGYDVLRDLAPVSTVSSGVFVLVVNPSLPAKTTKELIALAKSRPGQMNYGSAGGVASPSHLAAEMLKSRAGINLVHVPYQGAIPMYTAASSGEVAMGIASLAGALPFVTTGKLRAMGVTTPRRSPAIPDVPTIAESLPGFDITPWYGIFAPSATPAEIINLMSVEIGRIVQLPDVQKTFANLGLESASSTLQRFRQILQTEIEQWRKVVKEANIKLE